ncbi:MAG: hypothetical protein AB7V44_01070, partial [Pseudonocardia sp.]
ADDVGTLKAVSRGGSPLASYWLLAMALKRNDSRAIDRLVERLINREVSAGGDAVLNRIRVEQPVDRLLNQIDADDSEPSLTLEAILDPDRRRDAIRSLASTIWSRQRGDAEALDRRALESARVRGDYPQPPEARKSMWWKTLRAGRDDQWKPDSEALKALLFLSDLGEVSALADLADHFARSGRKDEAIHVILDSPRITDEDRRNLLADLGLSKLAANRQFYVHERDQRTPPPLLSADDLRRSPSMDGSSLDELCRLVAGAGELESRRELVRVVATEAPLHAEALRRFGLHADGSIANSSTSSFSFPESENPQNWSS